MPDERDADRRTLEELLTILPDDPASLIFWLKGEEAYAGFSTHRFEQANAFQHLHDHNRFHDPTLQKAAKELADALTDFDESIGIHTIEYDMRDLGFGVNRGVPRQHEEDVAQAIFELRTRARYVVQCYENLKQLGAALRMSQQPAIEAAEPVCPVCLTDAGEAFINGESKGRLSARQARVIHALIDVFPSGIKSEELDKRAGCSNARKHLVRLRDKAHHWKQVIVMPGRSGYGHGYRLGSSS